jgi:PII-like signaling protein
MPEEKAMQVPRDSVLLRIFVGENDRLGHKPLYEAIVMRARESHLAGATVLRGPLGFGHSSRIHTSKLLEMSNDLSYVVEIVDKDEKIQAFLPDLDKLMMESKGSGLVTLEHVQVLQYGPVSQ